MQWILAAAIRQVHPRLKPTARRACCVQAMPDLKSAKPANNRLFRHWVSLAKIDIHDVALNLNCIMLTKLYKVLSALKFSATSAPYINKEIHHAKLG